MQNYNRNNQQLSCMQCLYTLHPTSSQYYCCNKNQRYCIICQKYKCRRCNKNIQNRYQPKRCKTCSAINQNNQLIQPICQATYCGRCLVTRIIRSTPIKDKKYILPCQHQIEVQKVQNFLKDNFCYVCGSKYDGNFDYQLVTGGKCCLRCFKWQRKKVQGFLIVCLGCEKVIRKSSELSNVGDGLILCDDCAKQSCKQEQLCLKENIAKKVQRHQQKINNYVVGANRSPQKEQPNKIPQQSLKNQSPYKIYKKNDSQSNQQYQTKISQPKPVNPPNINITYSPSKQLVQANKSPPKQTNSIQNQQKSNSKPKVNIIYQDSNFNQYKNGNKNTTENRTDSVQQNSKYSLKQQSIQKRIKEQGSSKIQSNQLNQPFKQVESVLVVQQLKQQPIRKVTSPPKPPLPPNTKSPRNKRTPPKIDISIYQKPQPLSPNTSTDISNFTIIQQFPQQPQSPYPHLSIKKFLSMNTFIEQMKIQILQDTNVKLITCKECGYQLQQQQGFSIENNKHQVDWYCRICYMILTNKQLLGFNVLGTQPKLDKSRNVRGTSSQRHKIPTNLYHKQQAVNNNNLLSPLTTTSPPIMRITTSTTNHTVYVPSVNTNPMKKSDTFAMNTVTTASNSPYYQKLAGIIKVSDSRTLNREECVTCKTTGQSLVRTSNRGAICFACYYKK